MALLTEGRILILSPLENEDLQLRCVVASAKPCKNASAAALHSHATTANVNEAAAGQHLQTKVHSQAADDLSSPLPESRIEKHRQNRVRSCNRGSTQLEKVVDTVHRERCNEQNRHGQVLCLSQNLVINNIDSNWCGMYLVVGRSSSVDASAG